MLEQEGRINPRSTNSNSNEVASKQPEVNKLSSELKMEVDQNFERAKKNKLVSI